MIAVRAREHDRSIEKRRELWRRATVRADEQDGLRILIRQPVPAHVLDPLSGHLTLRLRAVRRQVWGAAQRHRSTRLELVGLVVFRIGTLPMIEACFVAT